MQPPRPVVVPYTYAEYAALPPDGRRWELIDGDFEVIPAPAPRHQTVSRHLQFELMQALEETGVAHVYNAPIDVILSQTDVLQPDLVILRADRAHLVSERGIEGPPDIVVEILSPSTRVIDRRVKSRTYARYGVPEYWIVDGDIGLIELYRLGAEGYVIERRFDRASKLETPRFPELHVDLMRAFRK